MTRHWVCGWGCWGRLRGVNGQFGDCTCSLWSASVSKYHQVSKGSKSVVLTLGGASTWVAAVCFNFEQLWASGGSPSLLFHNFKHSLAKWKLQLLDRIAQDGLIWIDEKQSQPCLMLLEPVASRAKLGATWVCWCEETMLVFLLFLIEVNLSRMQELHYPSEKYHQVPLSIRGVPPCTLHPFPFWRVQEIQGSQLKFNICWITFIFGSICRI